MKSWLFTAIATVMVLSGCSRSELPVSSNAPTMDSVAQSYYEDYLRIDPLTATQFGDHRYNDQLPNTLTAAHRDERRAFFSRYRDLLRSMNYESLSEADKMSYDVLMWECEVRLGRLEFNDHLLPVNQFWSFNLEIGDYASGTSMIPFKTVVDYDNWLSRLNQYVAWCDTAIANMQKGVREGYVLPKALVEKAIPQWTSMSKGPVEKHLFYNPVLIMPDSFPPAEKDRLTQAYRLMVEEKIILAHARVEKFLKDVYLPASRSGSGIDQIPGGDGYYKFLVKQYTTTDISPDSVFELGMAEVDRIMKETQAVMRQLNYTGDVKSFFAGLLTMKELTPFKRPEEVIANFNAIHERMKTNLSRLFKNSPKTPFEVRRTPAYREASASAEYLTGSEDGTRPGIFYVPIPDATKYNVQRDEDLFLHEAIPGHHYQLSLQQENKTLPRFRKITNFGAYAEGWALYTESLGKELGLYEDPYQYLGMLGGEMHRAIRLVVDAGMHSKGWTREQAIQFSKDHEALSEEGIVAEIERYMAIPGQALSYKMGQLKIRELRRKAEIELGTKFNIADFHDEVLNSGSLPLMVLEKKINRWIEARKRQS